MQDDFPLTLQHARRRMRDCHPSAQVSTLTPDGAVRARASGRSASASTASPGRSSDWGSGQGDRVGTFAWNNQRHFELYMAVPCVGAVLHTLNIRLFAEQLTYIVNHAEDRVIFVDDSLVGLLEPLAPSFAGVRHFVLMGDPRDAGIPTAARPPCRTCCATRSCWSRPARARSTTPSSTSARPRRSATRAAPPATPRACCTRTARSACTRRPR